MMGMFDTFVDDGEWQTKGLPCELNRWAVGDSVTSRYGTPILSDFQVEVYNLDEATNELAYRYAVVRGGVFVGVQEHADPALTTFDSGE